MCDNTVSVVWTLPEADSKIDHYILEHRRTNHEGPPRIREDYPWMVVEGIREMEHTLTGCVCVCVNMRVQLSRNTTLIFDVLRSAL